MQYANCFFKQKGIQNIYSQVSWGLSGQIRTLGTLGTLGTAGTLGSALHSILAVQPVHLVQSVRATDLLVYRQLSRK